MSKTYVLDTNIILDKPSAIFEFPSVILPVVVLDELDTFKKSGKIEGKNTRQAFRELDKLVNAGNIVNPTVTEYGTTLQVNVNEYVKYPKNDDKILFTAKDTNSILVTNDLKLRIKANALGVETQGLVIEEDTIYTGIKEYSANPDEIASIYQNPSDNILGCLTNQYLLLKDSNGKVVDRMKWTGERYTTLKLPPSKVIKPLNDKQAFALDLLNDRDIPIKIVAGTYGSGKTILTIRMGLYHVLQKGNYNKVMVVRNPIGAGEEIGFIKGDLGDKIAPFYKPIEQNLEGGEIQLQQMIQYKQLEYLIPFYSKGQSVTNSFMMVEEAEDMDVRLIKLIGTRVAEGSCICFSGDWKQSEAKFIQNNGLVHLINKTKGNPLVGTVVLDSDVRSEASRVFAELD